MNTDTTKVGEFGLHSINLVDPIGYDSTAGLARPLQSSPKAEDTSERQPHE